MPVKKRNKTTYHSKNKPSTGLFARRGLLVVFLICLTALLLFGLFQLLAYIGSLFFSRNPAFALQSIEMSSDGRFSSAQLEKFAAIEPEINLFAVDFDRLRQNLESVPQIESVHIQRQLPSTLIIHVVERDPVVQVRFQRKGFLYLLDHTGVAMRPDATRSSELALPLIDGLTVKEPMLGDQVNDAGVQHVLEILAALDDPVLGLGTQIHFDSFDLRYPDFINARFNDGKTSARFPLHSARERLIRLVVALQKAQEMGEQIKTVDLIPDGRNVPCTFY